MPYVAGILDPYGGLNVIIGTASELFFATRCDEMCLVVPDMDEPDPPEWERIPYIVARVERHVQWWAATRNDREFEKPLCDVPIERWPELMPIKMYLLRCTEDPAHKRALNTEYVVMG